MFWVIPGMIYFTFNSELSEQRREWHNSVIHNTESNRTRSLSTRGVTWLVILYAGSITVHLRCPQSEEYNMTMSSASVELRGSVIRNAEGGTNGNYNLRSAHLMFFKFVITVEGEWPIESLSYSCLLNKFLIVDPKWCILYIRRKKTNNCHQSRDIVPLKICLCSGDVASKGFSQSILAAEWFSQSILAAE